MLEFSESALEKIRNKVSDDRDIAEVAIAAHHDAEFTRRLVQDTLFVAAILVRAAVKVGFRYHTVIFDI